MLANGGGLPFNNATVHACAERAGVGLDGVHVQLLEGADDIRYLDSQGAIAMTDSGTIRLGPASFQDEETLVRTLAHERQHIYQQQVWPTDEIDSTTRKMFEDAAYAVEDPFWDYFRRGGPE